MIIFDGLFVGLVMLDGWLTQKALALGAVEANPFTLWNIEHLWARALIAIAIVLVLRFFGKGHLVEWVCFAWICICVWNMTVVGLGEFIVMNVKAFG